MTTAKTTAQINLLEIANQLALTAKSLQKKVDTDGFVIVTASQLAGKMPELKVLNDTAIFRLRKGDDYYKADTLTAYTDDNGEAKLYSADLTELVDFTAIKYKSGISGYIDIKHKSGLELKISISTNDDHILELEESESPGFEGEGMPKPDYLRLVPQPETPLYSDVLPHNIEIEILSNGRKSRKFETPLVTVKLPNGKIIKNVICNAALERIYQDSGNGAKFKIVGKRARKNKEGQPIDSDGKVNPSKHSYIVDIVNCQSIDFADL
jgi:hypothetical protein